MKITVAKTAGFCMGVQRAVDMALDAANKFSPPIFTYGPLIHNPQVMKLLAEKGISVLNEIPEKGSGTVLVRAHGIPPGDLSRLKDAGFNVIDATCPRVIRVQTIISRHAGNDYACIIIGDADHPEVRGLLGVAGDRGFVADGLSELEKLPEFEKAIVVAQTTQNTLLYEAVKKWMEKHRPHYKIFETICDSTEQRQAETKRLTETVDAVVVVGGHDSGNTRRLSEVAGEAGKPSYHIETEAELDVNALAKAESIGITAGASTPNWIIKRIYRSIESLPFEKTPVWKRKVLEIQRLLILTNVYVGLGAGSLCLACSVLQGIPRPFPYIIIALFYVISMHTLNNLIGIREARYNDPERSAFYDAHKVVMTLIALISGAIGLSVAAGVGMMPFIILLVMSVLGLSYNIKVIPDFIPGFRFRRLRDIPGSKTALISMAWGIVTALFPILAATGGVVMETPPVLVWAVSMAFVRTAYFDVLDVQGDRIVGKETLPILMGEGRTLALLKAMTVFIALILLVCAGFGVFTKLGYLLLACPVFLMVIISAHNKGGIVPGLRIEFLTESQFILSGILALAWVIFVG